MAAPPRRPGPTPGLDSLANGVQQVGSSFIAGRLQNIQIGRSQPLSGSSSPGPRSFPLSGSETSPSPAQMLGSRPDLLRGSSGPASSLFQPSQRGAVHGDPTTNSTPLQAGSHDQWMHRTSNLQQDQQHPVGAPMSTASPAPPLVQGVGSFPFGTPIGHSPVISLSQPISGRFFTSQAFSGPPVAYPLSRPVTAQQFPAAAPTSWPLSSPQALRPISTASQPLSRNPASLLSGFESQATRSYSDLSVFAPFNPQSAPGPFSPLLESPSLSGTPSAPPSPDSSQLFSAPQPPHRMYGMTDHPKNTAQSNKTGQLPSSGSQASSSLNVDPDQIPRPIPCSSTRAGSPHSARSNFVVEDKGNCSPRLMRCNFNQIPCTNELRMKSNMPLALVVQPFAFPHPSEQPIQVVDLGESGPIRCSRCKGYINPFMKFIDQGRSFICNLCGCTNATPHDYYCNLGPDGRRCDADDRPELCRGSVEFVATKEFMVRDPMPAVFFFLIDVTMNAVETGAVAAACGAVRQAIADLPEGPQTMVGLATFDSSIHFYNLKRNTQQALMLIVPDVEDVYAPLHSELIVPLVKCHHHLEQLLESIPTTFEKNRIVGSAFGAAIKASFLALRPTGGKLLVFQSVLPTVGIGSLAGRGAEGRINASTSDEEAQKWLQPRDDILKAMALEFAEYHVCVDVFITAQMYVDIASISVVPRNTGGKVYQYYPFSALSDSVRLYNDLKWNITRPQGLEAVMRVRCSKGLDVQDYYGSFHKRNPTDIDLPAIDCDKAILAILKHEGTLQEGSNCSFQCALLYTTVHGQRRIRVINQSLPITKRLSDLFRSANLDTLLACFQKQALHGIQSSSLSRVREQMIDFCINVLYSYRKFCVAVPSSGQLILPESLKLLPLYTLALTKSIGLCAKGRPDDRSYWINHAASLPTSLTIPLVYPRMLAILDLISKEHGGSIIPSSIPLSSAHIRDDGIYLLENGDDVLIYVGSHVDEDILGQIFGYPSIDHITSTFTLEKFENELSKRLNDVVNEIRRQRSSFLRLRLCRKGDSSGELFFSYMIEDKTPEGLSYEEFLVHIYRQIQARMS